MTAAAGPETPRGVSFWARRWGVSRRKARALLKLLRRRYGSRAVWEVPCARGPGKPALVASERSLAYVEVLRGEEGVVVGYAAIAEATSSAGRQSDEDGDDGERPVTQEQLRKALSEVYAALGRVSRGVRG